MLENKLPTLEAHDECSFSTIAHRATGESRVLKNGDTFALFDRLGEIGLSGYSEQGLYHQGTRFVSRWEVLVNGYRPTLLSSAVREDNNVLLVQMTLPDIDTNDGERLPQGTLHLYRSLIVKDSCLFELLKIANYSAITLNLVVEYRFDSDYRDIFEIRGAARQRRGKLLKPVINQASVELAYRGLDDTTRCSRFEFVGDVVELHPDKGTLVMHIEPGAEKALQVMASCGLDNDFSDASNHSAAVEAFEQRRQQEQPHRTEIFTSNEQFNDWLRRSESDLSMLATDTPFGRYPYAGVPWFATPFGRDGIITALQTLWVQPRLARGTLSFLASTQASDVDPTCEAEPGKIIHEMRQGEMATLGEIPFRKYYGTVDATPLFVILAGKYYQRTGDRDFIDYSWNNILRAVAWIDLFGDLDGDGFLEYAKHSERGLAHQCWKDSNDSIFHADGSDALGPIACSEVQGYAYQAKLLAATLAEVMNDYALAAKWNAEAARLKQRFNEAYWVDALGTFAIALDGQKRPCCVRNSNVGHLLYSGIVEERYAERVAATLTNDNAFNGWGIRTISKGEARYNPMSYHNGSIWPHDTAIAAAGLAAYGFDEESKKIIAGLFDASLFNELHRLPELFCGFERLPGHGPTLYPVACSPQAWAAGAVFLVLQAMLGISFSPNKPQICFRNPKMPRFLDWVRVRNLRVGEGAVDLILRRHPRDVGLNVERKEGDVRIVVIA